MPLPDRPAIRRRGFLRAGAAGLAGAALGTLWRPQPVAAAQTTRIVLTKNAGATDESGAGVPAVVKEMVDRTLRELTGKDSIADAWREFVSPDDVVGLKINLRGGQHLSTQPCVIDAIVDGLTAAGVRPNNIIAWDAWTREFGPAGFSINDSDSGVKYLATDHGARLSGSDDERKEALKAFYSSSPVPVGDQEVYFSKILADEVTALINIPLIKDHRIAGVTCSMKNHFGSILNPSHLHGNSCDPYLPQLNATRLIKEKTRLILVDGLRGIYNGGPRDKPQWRWQPNCIMAGTDPVAIDSQALRIIETKRQEAGMPPIGDRAHYLDTAAASGLGTNDLAQIDLREIDSTSVS